MAESDVFPLTVGIVLFDDVEVLDPTFRTVMSSLYRISRSTSPTT